MVFEVNEDAVRMVLDCHQVTDYAPGSGRLAELTRQIDSRAVQLKAAKSTEPDVQEELALAEVEQQLVTLEVLNSRCERCFPDQDVLRRKI